MERVCGIFVEGLVSGLKAKLEGQDGGLLVRFGEAVLGEATLRPMKCDAP